MMVVHEGSPTYWAIRSAWLLAMVGIVTWVPGHVEVGSIHDVANAFELMAVAMALNLVFGYAGIISIGHSAFFLIGGYATGILVTQFYWSPYATIAIGAIIAFAVGAVVALPTLKLSGVYLALVTLVVATLLPALAKWRVLSEWTNGARGISDVGYGDLPDLPLLGHLVGREGRAVFSYWMAVLVLCVAYVVCRGIVRSRVGRSLVAIRDNETAAKVMGVNLAQTKMMVFGVSAAITAMVGSVSALRTTYVGPDVANYTIFGSVTFLLVMVLGGAGTLWGPILGGAAYVAIETRARDAAAGESGFLSHLTGDWFSGSPAPLLLAITLIVLMFVAPFGLVGLAQRITRRVVTFVPRPVGVRDDHDGHAGDDEGPTDTDRPAPTRRRSDIQFS